MSTQFDDPDFDDPFRGTFGDSHAGTVVNEEQPSFDGLAWQARGEELARRHADALKASTQDLDWCKWKIGDWLVEGEPHYPPMASEVISGYKVEYPPDVYAIAAGITSLKRYTLKDMSSTARRFPASARTDACSWTHHRALINALPKADENTLRQWLRRIADEKLSVAKLQKAIRSPTGKPVKEKTFRVTVPLSTWETLKDFADNERCAIQKTASRWIDERASLNETQAFRKAAKQETADRRYQKRRRNGLKVAETYDNLGLRKPGGQNYIG
jgi:hypothetical protein